MAEAATMIPASVLANVLNWWQDAGVDTLVDEAPLPWLARSKAAAARPAPAVVTPASAPAAPTLPATLDAFIPWFAETATLNGCGPAAARLAPSGNPQASFMALIDMPEAGDAARGQLLSGEAGGLFDNMLKALKLARADIWLGSLCPDFRPGPGIDDQLAEIARHHIGLVAPQRLWLMGDTVSRAILGMGVMEAKGRKHFFNHKGINVAVVATYHPRFLLKFPARKKEVWEDMQRLIEED